MKKVFLSVLLVLFISNSFCQQISYNDNLQACVHGIYFECNTPEDNVYELGIVITKDKVVIDDGEEVRALQVTTWKYICNVSIEGYLYFMKNGSVYFIGVMSGFPYSYIILENGRKYVSRDFDVFLF